MIITIDGPAGTGKSTVAQHVAETLGISFFDTGAMYRAVTYGLIKKGIAFRDLEKLQQFLDAFQFSIQTKGKEKKYFLNQEDITEAIRTSAVTQKVSEVSSFPIVRNAVVSIQRRFAAQGDAVFEGRDMGTVVFPNADLKFFLTASPEIRAKRRFLDKKSNLGNQSQEEVFFEIMERDRLDSTREHSPLRKAGDAIEIDTSDLSISQVVDRIVSFYRKKFL